MDFESLRITSTTSRVQLPDPACIDLVCFGHNHRFSLERYGETVALNPGTLMGTAFGPGGAEPVPVTFATFDTKTGQPALYRLSAGVIELSTWERPNS